MSDIDVNDWNAKVIAEFRANAGVVGGPFTGAPMVLITTTGAKSGQRRVSPLVYLPDGERVVIFASKAGAPTNPDWFHNIKANPAVTVEVGAETYEATAVVVEGAERDQLFDRQKAAFGYFAEYEKATTRVIPVVALVRIA